MRVTEIGQLENSYGMALGKITLDLTDLEMTKSAEVRLSVGAGEVQVRVPDDVPFRVVGSVGAGGSSSPETPGITPVSSTRSGYGASRPDTEHRH